MTARSFSIVFRRELRALFLTPIAYIVIALFLVVVGWFFFATFFLAGRADLRDFFSLLPLILSFTVPATTMRLFAEERRSGSYEILCTLPLTGMDVLLAKYASAVAFTLIAVFPTLSVPAVHQRAGRARLGTGARGLPRHHSPRPDALRHRRARLRPDQEPDRVLHRGPGGLRVLHPHRQDALLRSSSQDRGGAAWR